ncbi:hypothetical protein [Pectinatus brassicae]|uniref:Uncharacterized protein n=1 Tax=Pectinatus brassicae TaxID=862415 RepID=A0A840UXH1_9FIRM|nr:hypothetical protein [Pectinatus brassicae]MBB5337563.1 hypothetical protein [Pectinatus brassicae]
MQKAISAAAYAEHCGLDVKVVKKYCNQGIIPHLRNGVFYLIWPDKADVALLEHMNNNMQKLKNKAMTKEDKSASKIGTTKRPAISIKSGAEYIATINKLQRGGRKSDIRNSKAL